MPMSGLNASLGSWMKKLNFCRWKKESASRVKKQMEKGQKEYILNEKIKAIQKELGDADEGVKEVEYLARKIEESGMSAEAAEKAGNELRKLKMMSPMSAEATVVRNYIDWLLALPWKQKSRISQDLNKAQKILDDDHYGLEKVKDRILEYLAVQKRVKKIQSGHFVPGGPARRGQDLVG